MTKCYIYLALVSLRYYTIFLYKNLKGWIHLDCSNCCSLLLFETVLSHRLRFCSWVVTSGIMIHLWWTILVHLSFYLTKVWKVKQRAQRSFPSLATHFLVMERSNCEEVVTFYHVWYPRLKKNDSWIGTKISDPSFFYGQWTKSWPDICLSVDPLYCCESFQETGFWERLLGGLGKEGKWSDLNRDLGGAVEKPNLSEKIEKHCRREMAQARELELRPGNWTIKIYQELEK